MASKQIRDQFNDLLKRWSNLTVNAAVKPEFGDKGAPRLAKIHSDVNHMLQVATEVQESISSKGLHDFIQCVNELWSQINQFIRADEATFFSNKMRWMQDVETTYDKLLALWPDILVLYESKLRSEGRGGAGPAFDKVLADVRAAGEESIAKLKESLAKEAEQLSSALKEVQAGTLINQESRFQSEAKLCITRAYIWLGISVALGLAFFCVLKYILHDFCFELRCYEKIALLNYESVCKDCNRSVLYLEMTKAIFYRILVISFLLFLVGIAVRNYYAAMHNYTVNKHKQNSLAAALVMINQKLSPAGQDDIMYMAASAIFSHQNTGYNKKTPENIVLSAANDLAAKLKRGGE